MTPQYQPFLKAVPFTKLDEQTHEIFGRFTAEIPDKDFERCIYADTKPEYVTWSEEARKSTMAAGQEPSLGNVRIQHGSEVGGKVRRLDFNDAAKEVMGGVIPISDVVFNQCKQGFFRGFSQAGNYLYRKCSICGTDLYTGRWCPKCQAQVIVDYAATIAEVSLVDNPCLAEATFTYVKADGSAEVRKWAPREAAEPVPVATTETVIKDALRAGLDAAEQFKIAVGLLEKQPRRQDGKFIPEANGPVHDKLKDYGYAHVRTGSSAQTGFEDQSQATTIYAHDNGSRIQTNDNGDWKYDDGHHNEVTGHGMDTLAAHLAHNSKAAKGVDDMSDLTLTSISGIERAAGESADAFVKRAIGEVVTGCVTITDIRSNGDGTIVLVNKSGFACMMSDNVARFMTKAEAKTKRVAGEDLTADCFIIVGDPDDTSTWKLPYKFSTDEKTKSHLRNAVARFDQLKGVSADEKDKAWSKLVALCHKYDIDVEDDKEAAASSAAMLKALREAAKSMYHISDLAALLQAIYWIQLGQFAEGEWERDEDNFAIAERLGAWLADGVEILKDMVEEETAQLTEPAMKAAFFKGELFMNYSKMLEAVQEALAKSAGFTSHFKAAAAHHEMKAAHHEKHAAAHTEAHGVHKAMGEEHHKMAAHHAADKVMADHHKALGENHMKMAAHHTAKAAHHTAMHKSHADMCQNCKGMCDHMEGAGKAMKSAAELAAETPNNSQAQDDLRKSMDNFGVTLTSMQELLKATTPEAIAAKVEETVQKTVDAALAKSLQTPPAGLTLVPPNTVAKGAAAPSQFEEHQRDTTGGIGRPVTK